MHFASIIFPNGVEIALPGSLDKVPGSSGAQVKNSEGTVEQGSKTDYGCNPRGAGVGSLAEGEPEMQAWGRNRCRCRSGDRCSDAPLTRGNDIVFPPGITVEMVLNRPLEIQQSQLAGMPSYTGVSAPVEVQQSPVITPTPHN
jgi:hypothetical protein